MTEKYLSKFPTTEFAAFSTTKMSHFLPYTEETSVTGIKNFFAEDFGKKANIINNHLVVLGSEGWAPVPFDRIVAKFSNNKYKIIDIDYYQRNFNDPVVDADGKGIY